MKTLTEKMQKSIFYTVVSLIIAIALPIFLKNAWASLIGVAATSLFLYQTFVYYRAMKNEDFITIPAECIKKTKGDLGAMTYSEKCYFQPLPKIHVNGVIELQIATENNALVSDKLRRKKKRNNDKVYVGERYELVFSKPSNESLEKLSADDFTNANFIALSVLRCEDAREKNSESEEKTANIPNTD